MGEVPQTTSCGRPVAACRCPIAASVGAPCETPPIIDEAGGTGTHTASHVPPPVGVPASCLRSAARRPSRRGEIAPEHVRARLAFAALAITGTRAATG
jgi:hypothetical protein